MPGRDKVSSDSVPHERPLLKVPPKPELQGLWRTESWHASVQHEGVVVVHGTVCDLAQAAGYSLTRSAHRSRSARFSVAPILLKERSSAVRWARYGPAASAAAPALPILLAPRPSVVRWARLDEAASAAAPTLLIPLFIRCSTLRWDRYGEAASAATPSSLILLFH